MWCRDFAGVRLAERGFLVGVRTGLGESSLVIDRGKCQSADSEECLAELHLVGFIRGFGTMPPHRHVAREYLPCT